ncbi:MAG: hypothetical protein KF812_12555 [Fimbriimonadaceae bacterium]|nr:hypothetical protein [Fimbriimonadaceae bacterium]
MSMDCPTTEWAVDDIDRMLELLKVVESPDFVAFTWPDLPERTENGVRVLQMPYPVYLEAVDQLWKALYDTTAYIDPYAPLPENPTQDGMLFSVLGAHFPPDYFETATLNQVRRYLVLCTRGERFCDGHIAGEFESGALHAALARLKQIRSELQ